MEQSTEIIRSRQNRIVSEAAKLTDRKARERSRCFRFDGYKLLEEAVRSGLALEAAGIQPGGAARPPVCALRKRRFAGRGAGIDGFGRDF